ncbi:hypothetical protein, partial [Romboutsia sp.]|uniref:hypothetical protein n=1 Tax=Romboutsia sp. TaxID=1965302 RepID=UPI002BAF342A
ITRRKELMEELQAILGEEVPFITLLNQDVINVYNKNFGENWVMQKGFGIINRFSFLNNDSVVASSSKDNSTIYRGAGIVAAGLAAFIYFNKKKRA